MPMKNKGKTKNMENPTESYDKKKDEENKRDTQNILEMKLKSVVSRLPVEEQVAEQLAPTTRTAQVETSDKVLSVLLDLETKLIDALNINENSSQRLNLINQYMPEIIRLYKQLAGNPQFNLSRYFDAFMDSLKLEPNEGEVIKRYIVELDFLKKITTNPAEQQAQKHMEEQTALLQGNHELLQGQKALQIEQSKKDARKEMRILDNHLKSLIKNKKMTVVDKDNQLDEMVNEVRGHIEDDNTREEMFHLIDEARTKIQNAPQITDRPAVNIEEIDDPSERNREAETWIDKYDTYLNSGNVEGAQLKVIKKFYTEGAAKKFGNLTPEYQTKLENVKTLVEDISKANKLYTEISNLPFYSEFLYKGKKYVKTDASVQDVQGFIDYLGTININYLYEGKRNRFLEYKTTAENGLREAQERKDKADAEVLQRDEEQRLQKEEQGRVALEFADIYYEYFEDDGTVKPDYDTSTPEQRDLLATYGDEGEINKNIDDLKKDKYKDYFKTARYKAVVKLLNLISKIMESKRTRTYKSLQTKYLDIDDNLQKQWKAKLNDTQRTSIREDVATLQQLDRTTQDDEPLHHHIVALHKKLIKLAQDNVANEADEADEPGIFGRVAQAASSAASKAIKAISPSPAGNDSDYIDFPALTDIKFTKMTPYGQAIYSELYYDDGTLVPIDVKKEDAKRIIDDLTPMRDKLSTKVGNFTEENKKIIMKSKQRLTDIIDHLNGMIKGSGYKGGVIGKVKNRIVNPKKAPTQNAPPGVQDVQDVHNLPVDTNEDYDVYNPPNVSRRLFDDVEEDEDEDEDKGKGKKKGQKKRHIDPIKKPKPKPKPKTEGKVKGKGYKATGNSKRELMKFLRNGSRVARVNSSNLQN